jgi:DNA polymerase-3 subunit epsilon
VLLSTDVRRELSVSGASADLQALAGAFNELARQRDQLKADIAAEVAQASRGIEQERNRLAALMSELTQSVVVCNLDGRVLLYNNRARMQFRALSDAPALADGAELIGLGRSIYAVFERRWWRMRWRACSSACSAARPTRRAVRHQHAHGPAAARADGARA